MMLNRLSKEHMQKVILCNVLSIGAKLWTRAHGTLEALGDGVPVVGCVSYCRDVIQRVRKYTTNSSSIE